jgi:hypothetical protein
MNPPDFGTNIEILFNRIPFWNPGYTRVLPIVKVSFRQNKFELDKDVLGDQTIGLAKVSDGNEVVSHAAVPILALF